MAVRAHHEELDAFALNRVRDDGLRLAGMSMAGHCKSGRA